jgi:hypothetical protein
VSASKESGKNESKKRLDEGRSRTIIFLFTQITFFVPQCSIPSNVSSNRSVIFSFLQTTVNVHPMFDYFKCSLTQARHDVTRASQQRARWNDDVIYRLICQGNLSHSFLSNILYYVMFVTKIARCSCQHGIITERFGGTFEVIEH